MKYAIAAIALVGAAVAMPTEPEPAHWETWTTTSCTTTPAAETWKDWKPTTTPCTDDDKKTWENYPKPTPKCSEIKTEYYTKYDDENNKWGNYHVETKYVTEYPETCTWNEWSTTKPVEDVKTWSTWAPVVPEKEKCYYTTTYTTTECGSDKAKWDNCKAVTKTETKETDTCTWAAWSTTKETPVAETTTWATWGSTKETPAASTTEWNTWKPTSSVPAPVAKWTGAANKANIAGGLAGVAGLAALLL